MKIIRVQVATLIGIVMLLLSLFFVMSNSSKSTPQADDTGDSGFLFPGAGIMSATPQAAPGKQARISGNVIVLGKYGVINNYPLDNVTVEVQDMKTGATIGQATTWIGGNFTLLTSPLFAPTEVTIKLTRKGYETESTGPYTVNPGYGYELPNSLIMYKNITQTITLTGNIYGVADKHIMPEPLEDVTIEVKEYGSKKIIATGYSNEKGEFNMLVKLPRAANIIISFQKVYYKSLTLSPRPVAPGQKVDLSITSLFGSERICLAHWAALPTGLRFSTNPIIPLKSGYCRTYFGK